MTNLQRIRKEKGMSQKELADALGVTQGTVSAWESGRWDPTVENLRAVAKVLGVTVDELVKDVDFRSTR
jgi:transcriptional regulator with XRE-family HTH domain